MPIVDCESELWIVRHGETEWSRAWKHTSFTDLTLTDEGEEQAKALGPLLAGVPFDLVLTSPRLRARETAALSGYGDATIDSDLAEWDYGDYEGITTAEIRRTVPDWTVWTHPCPNGETADEVAERLDRVVARARRHRRTLVYAHGHSLRVLTARWLGLPVVDGRLFFLDTATYSVLSDDRGQPVVTLWNVSRRD